MSISILFSAGMRMKRYAVLCSLVIVANLLAGPGSFFVRAADARLTRETIVQEINRLRGEAHLAPLVISETLTTSAQAKAIDMTELNYFSHESPNGKTPWDWMHEQNYSFLSAGENLALDYDDAASLLAAWMKSPTHRANILNRNFQQIGIGITFDYLSGAYRTVVVAHFAMPATEQAIETVFEEPAAGGALPNIPTLAQPKPSCVTRTSPFTIRGTALPSVKINVFRDDTLATQVTTSANGTFTAAVSFPKEGSCVLSASASFTNGDTSDRSAPLTCSYDKTPPHISDGSLIIFPASLRDVHGYDLLLAHPEPGMRARVLLGASSLELRETSSGHFTTTISVTGMATSLPARLILEDASGNESAVVLLLPRL